MKKKNETKAGTNSPPSSEKIITEYSHLGELGEVKPKSDAVQKKLEKSREKLAKLQKKTTLHSADEHLIPIIPIPTGFQEVDIASGIGGMANNIIIVCYGTEGVGKSYFAQKIVAQAQRQFLDKYCIYVDVECGLDHKRMRQIGIDTSQLQQLEFDYAEDLFGQLKELIPHELYSVIVVDSIAALVTKTQMEGEFTDKQPALLASVLTKALSEFMPLCKKHGTVLIFINQLRENFGAQSFVKTTSLPCGRALKFSAGMMLEFTKFFSEKKSSFLIKNLEGVVIGQRVNVKFIKNKCAPPLREGMFELYFDEPDLISEVIRKAKKAKLWRIQKGWHIYVDRSEQEYKEENEESFIEMLLLNDLVYEMAERILEKEKSGELKEKILPDNFSLEKLRISLDKETAEDSALSIESEVSTEE